MKGTMTAGEVHKQYNEIVTAFRKLIPDPALRLTFSRQVDGYMRQYALGVCAGGQRQRHHSPTCGIL